MKSKETVYLVTVEHSPELRNDCGAFEVLGIFASYRDAMDRAMVWVYNERSMGYYLVDEYMPKRELYIILTYKDGNEDSGFWSQLSIMEHEVFE